MSDAPTTPTDLEAVASLAEPLRKDLYDYIAGASEAVSRDQAAEALGLSRQVAAYHLDRLAEDGLLEVEFRRLTGRAGPGAGRPAKLYRRSPGGYEVSIPPRRYELAARILLEVARQRGVDPPALADAARRAGHEIGRAGLEGALDGTGYEPVVEDGEVRFRNCPFHALREQDRDMTCCLNLALVEGILEGAGAGAGQTARLAPEEGYCCVRISTESLK